MRVALRKFEGRTTFLMAVFVSTGRWPQTSLSNVLGVLFLGEIKTVKHGKELGWRNVKMYHLLPNWLPLAQNHWDRCSPDGLDCQRPPGCHVQRRQPLCRVYPSLTESSYILFFVCKNRRWWCSVWNQWVTENKQTILPSPAKQPTPTVEKQSDKTYRICKWSKCS